MKKILLVLGLVTLILTGCGQKKEEKAKGNKEDITTNLPIINNAEQQEIITKKLVFPKDEKGAQSSQTITYQGKRFLTVVMEKIVPTEGELKEAIKEVGIEQAQKYLDESVAKDEEYAQAKTVSGFTSSVVIANEDELNITSTYDFEKLDIEKASSMSYFKNVDLKGMEKMSPEEYINNLLMNGAEEQQ
ncbi:MULTISPECIES: SP0191 family lipoprotein [Streptococcus]|uniref:SP0191 family lipoprotein n=1 Tax=Streptococcus TaxID=1301 RepID=UPI0011E6EBFF|nr:MULTISPECIES: SP0191 family lipoprotein [Streptococcus]MCD1277141.1 hypothetical protein [Streptococcus sinensis]MCF1283489.1 membrane lipoprotein lipid attachment site-containing protein [Streptococcus sinensis]